MAMTRTRDTERHTVVGGSATLYRLYDVGYEIDLPRAAELLPLPSPPRSRPRRAEAAALVTPKPPLTVELGSRTIEVDGSPLESQVSAAIFDFGVVSLRLRLCARPELSWSDFVHFGASLQGGLALRSICDPEIRGLLQALAPAVQRQAVAPVTEDYMVFRLATLRGAEGEPFIPPRLSSDALAGLLLNEARELSGPAKRELLPHRFAYTTLDYAALTWESALVIEPDGEDQDVEYVLEFANAQLLELRVFDAVLDAELPRMYDRIAEVRRKPYALFRPYRSLLNQLQTLVADTTEIVERVENALKVTDDVYLARVYSAALQIFRGDAWRRGIDRKLDIIRDTYTMLNAESQAARGEVMEFAILLLILGEILLTIFGRH
ncbi:MAG TPA: hypothetical protein VH763_20055 [Gemmatimonadales bacterium]|jgi:hypothetical protein